MNYVKLINSSESVSSYIACYNLTYNWASQTQDHPIPGSTTIQPVQFTGWKNPNINLNFGLYLVDNPTGFITLHEWNKLVKSNTDTILNVVLSDSDIAFSSFAVNTIGTSTIPIRIISWSTNFDPSDTKNCNIININAQCVESSI